MKAEFQAAFDSGLAQVERVIESPTGHPGWGSDLYNDGDLTPDCRELSGDDPLVVGQYTYRRIFTASGELPDDRDWGIDLKARLSSAFGETELRELQSEVLGEVARDDRLQNVSVYGTFDLRTESLELTIRAELVDSGESFLLTIVSDSDGSRLVEVVVNGQRTN